MSSLLLIFATGILLGLVFFWGLWVTVNQLNQARYPAVQILGSLMLRFGLVLIVFYLLAQNGDWQHLLVAAIGFTLSRLFIVYCTQIGKSNKELNI